jgi:heme-degrading monooxygenase HmoA
VPGSVPDTLQVLLPFQGTLRQIRLEAGMLARLWHGRVRSAKADTYETYLNRTGVPDYVATPGNRGAWVLRRTESDVTHFLLITLWESEAAIEAFAGVPIDRARYYAEDDDFLLEREPTVTHYVVAGGSTRVA